VTDLRRPRILITGAAGNLGSLLASHLHARGERLRLMIHRKPLAEALATAKDVEVVQADLDRPETLMPAVRGADVVVHFAGVLFAPRPERFLPRTNTRWFEDLLSTCLREGVSRVVLISFPHVEGTTTPEAPATGRLDGSPVSVHARTRLAEEQLLLAMTDGTATTPVAIRLGMVYGRGVLMVDAARWLARHRMLAVWREPTWIHLVSVPDFQEAVAAAATRPDVRGIYHVADESPLTLQQFLDLACAHWGAPRPWRAPVRLIYAAATLCELAAGLTRRASPLTRDFITIGRVSYCGDTRRAREELIPELRFPDLASGIATL
jgi:nucleoside-diphosphate-sugar epimerase